jgi:peroxiredoxin
MKSKRSLLLIVLLLAFCITAYFLLEDSFQTAADADPKKIDDLFEDIGIAKISPAAGPVDFELMTFDEETVRLSDFRGKIVFLNFWATWCYPCRIEMPAMENLHMQMKDYDFVMVAIGLKESAQQIRSFFEEKKLTFTSLVDPEGKVAKQFRIASIPTTLIVNKKGIVIGAALGPRPWDKKMSIRMFKYLVAME